MKTNEKTVALAAESSLNELIFENRNHAYGAYELRKKYDKRLLIGFVLAFLIFSSAIGVQVIDNYLRDQIIINVPGGYTTFAPDKLDPTPPLPPPPVPTIEMKIPRFKVPIIVDTTQIETELMPTEELIGQTENGDVPPQLAVVEREAEKQIIEDPDMPRWNVEVAATFEGGDIENFRQWVIKNMTYPAEAQNSGITGKVQIIFGVNSKGEVCNVTLRRGVHPSLDDAVIRTIMNAPKWQPARQNGTPVKQMFMLTVLFAQS
jgi:protein TonB